MTIESLTVTEPILQECLQAMQETRVLCMQIFESNLTNAESGPASSPSDESKASLERQQRQKQLFSNLAQLKGLHRSMYMGLRTTKQNTAEVRQEVDRLHLQLQNLYYEQKHLRGEIGACQDFPHTYITIPLVTEEEFLGVHPEHTDKDPHELMKERLHNERAVRDELESQRKQLMAKKQTLIAENKKRKDDLEHLDEQLKKFIESSKVIKQTFEKEY